MPPRQVGDARVTARPCPAYPRRGSHQSPQKRPRPPYPAHFMGPETEAPGEIAQDVQHRGGLQSQTEGGLDGSGRGKTSGDSTLRFCHCRLNHQDPRGQRGGTFLDQTKPSHAGDTSCWPALHRSPPAKPRRPASQAPVKTRTEACPVDFFFFLPK